MALVIDSSNLGTRGAVPSSGNRFCGGSCMNRILFVVSFVAALAVLSVRAPSARTQQAPLHPRMSASHSNAQGHFSLIDAGLPPTPTGTPPVGRFISGAPLGNLLSDGYAYPDQSQP